MQLTSGLWWLTGRHILLFSMEKATREIIRSVPNPKRMDSNNLRVNNTNIICKHFTFLGSMSKNKRNKLI